MSIFFPVNGGNLPVPVVPARIEVTLSAAPTLAVVLRLPIPARIQVALSANPAIAAAMHGGQAQRIQLTLSASPALAVALSGGEEFGSRLVVALAAAARLRATVRVELTYVPAIGSRDTEIAAGFFVNDVEVPFVQGRLSMPDGFAGASLTITLADLDLAAVPTNAPCHMNYIVDGVEIRRFTGRVAGYTHAQVLTEDGEIDDSIQVVCTGLLTDRAALAPEAITVLYNPNVVTEAELEFDEASLPRDPDGAVIEPVLVPMNNLSAYKVLDFVGDAIGYDISRYFDDYQIDRLDISPQAGYYAALEEVLAGIDTQRSVDDFYDTMVIDDLDRPLWTGMQIRQIDLDDMLPSITKQASDIINVVEMDYDAGALDDADSRYYEYELVDVAVEPDGDTIRGEGWKYLRYTKSYDHPGDILAEDTLYSEKRLFDADNEMVYREILTEVYAGLLKVGHTKRVWAMVPVGDGSGDTILDEIRNEEYNMTWAIRGGNWVLQQTKNKVVGVVALIEDPDTAEITYEAIDAATRTRQINGTSTFDVLDGVPLATEYEFYDVVSDDQYNHEVVIFDELKNTRSNGSSSSLQSGQPPTVAGGKKGRKRRLRTIENAASIATFGRRRAVPYKAGRLPFRLALSAGERRLARLAGQLREATLELPTPVYTLQRAAAFEITDINGNQGVWRVKAIDENIDENGIAQTVQLAEAVQ